MTGILFATLAALFFFSALAVFFPHDPTNTLGVYIIIGAIGSVFAAIAYWLLRKTVPVQIRPCPKCGSFESRPAGVLTRRRSWVLRHTLGFLVEALWGPKPASTSHLHRVRKSVLHRNQEHSCMGRSGLGVYLATRNRRHR